MNGIRKRVFVMLLALAVTLTAVMPGLTTAAYAESGGFEKNAVRSEGSMLFGTVEEYSTATAGEMLRDSYYFDDSWFGSTDAAERNDALALISMQLTGATLENDDNARGAAFLRNLGFGSIRTRDLGTVTGADGLDTGIGYTYGIKQIGDDTLAAVVIHSYALDNASKRSAWTQNFTINGSDPAAGDANVTGEQYAYKTAVSQFDVSALRQDMIDSAEAAGAGTSDSNLKFWVMGQSRGGAIANLLAVKINETATSGNVYAYTFEAPTTVDADNAGSPSDHAYIHNYITSNDIVTHVAPWGMTRYGNVYDLLTLLEAKGVTDDDVNVELEKLGSIIRVGTELPEHLTADALMEKLLEKIPTRADYSAVRQVSFTAFDGTPVAFDYTYQALFRDLMGAIFAEDGISADGMADRLSDLLAAFAPLLKGRLIEVGKISDPDAHDIDAYYWDTAGRLCEVLDSLDDVDDNVPLSEQDAYALLKLIAPLLIDTDAVEDGTEIDMENPDTDLVLSSVQPLIDLIGYKAGILESHQFDTLIARLKTLAPAPEMEDFNIEIAEPAAGETASRTPKRVAAAVDELGHEWLLASASWETDDKMLGSNKTYYLKAEFEVIGHSIPEDIKITINGKEPNSAPKITYNNGIQIVKATWKFTIGTPKEYTIEFISFDHGTVPEPMTVPAGTNLKYVDLPVMEDEGEYIFLGWKDDLEAPAENLVINSYTYLYGIWHRVVDNVSLSFDVPHVGDTSWKMPVSDDEELYTLEGFDLCDSTWETVRDAIPEGEMILSFIIKPGYDCEFALVDSYMNPDFAGVVTINGEEIEDYIYDTDGYISVTFRFTAKPKEDEPAPSGQASLSVTSAKLKAGDTIVLKTNGPNVTAWESSNKKAVTVTDGEVTALTKGKATITATLESGEKLTSTINVTTSPKLSKKTVTVKKGKTVKVAITGKAPGVDNAYKSTKKAKVIGKKAASKIKIKGLKKGKTTLKICVNGKWLKLKVKVK